MATDAPADRGGFAFGPRPTYIHSDVHRKCHRQPTRAMTPSRETVRRSASCESAWGTRCPEANRLDLSVHWLRNRRVARISTVAALTAGAMLAPRAASAEALLLVDA